MTSELTAPFAEEMRALPEAFMGPSSEFLKQILWKEIDRLESVLATCPQIEHDVTHTFTPGMYVRRIVMPAGSIYTSKVHKTEHPYVVTRGEVSVLQPDGTWQHIKSPYFGITKPGTRRVLAVHTETEWRTFHATNETDLAKIEKQVIEPHDFRESLTLEES